MSAPTPDNPAARLLALYTAGSEKTRRGQPARKVWAELLNVPDADLPLLLKKVGQVAGLAHDVREKVLRLKGLNPNNLITWIPKALGPFTTFNLDAPFQHFLAPIDDNVKSLLQICADALSNQFPEPIITREQLKELRQQLAEFVSALASHPLPDPARAFLMKHAQIIDDALIDYQLQGFEALTNGLERVIGHAALNRKSIVQWERESPEPFKKVKAVIAGFVLLLTTAGTAVKLLKDLDMLAPLLPSETEMDRTDGDLKSSPDTSLIEQKPTTGSHRNQPF